MNKINCEIFFNKLYEDEEFCQQLGKVTLSSSKLEVQLIKLLNNNSNVNNNLYNSTLGSLITKTKKENILTKNTIEALKLLSEQRNYLTHNIYSILSNDLDDNTLINSKKEHEIIKKNLLQTTSEEKSELLYSDTQLYIERAYILVENLNGMIEIIEKYNKGEK
ncbi:MAG: hypothetical protein U9Q04_06410 [Campylobacterota bacterium]|nr:hypothetical protein [Campylobacterota bacterium]